MVKLQKWTSKLLWVMLYIAPIVLASVHFGGKFIKKKLIAELNKSLAVKAEVNYVEFSGLRNLPRIGVTFHNLKVNEKGQKLGGHLLQAKKLSVLVNPMDLLSSTPSIDRVLIKDARVRILNDGDYSNYLIFKSDTTASTEEMNLDVKHIDIENVHVLYVQPDAQIQSEIQLQDLLLKGRMNDEQFTLSCAGNLWLESISSQKSELFAQAPIAVDLDVRVNQAIKSYSIERGNVSLHQMKLEAKGDVLQLPDGLDVDLAFEGTDFKVEELVKLADYSLEQRMSGLNGAGAISAKGTIKGIFSDEAWPMIQGDVLFKDVSAEDNSTGLKLNKLNADLHIDNTKKVWQLSAQIQDFKTARSHAEGNIIFQDLARGVGTSRLKGKIDLDEWSSYVNPEAISSLSGAALFNLKASFSDAAESIQFSDLNGDLELRRFALATPWEQKIEEAELNAHLNQNTTEVKLCMGKYNDVDFSLTGKVQNLMSYIFGDERMQIEGNLRSKNFDLDKVMHSTSESSEESEISLDLGVDMKVQVAAQKFAFSMLNAQDLRGEFQWKKENLRFKDMAFNAWQGSHTFDGSLKTISNGFALHGVYDTKNADIHEVFKDFENFQQEELTHENLWGQLTSNGMVHVDFDADFNFIEDQIQVLSEVVLVNGRLKEYKTLESLSSFVKVEDLKDVKFDKLENQIRIEKGVIYIPQMDISSSALNLSISGSHNFENFMKYKMALKVSELLASKSNWIARKKERGLDQDDQGSLTAYIEIIGTPDDLKIKYDRETVKEKLKEERKKESESFKKNLRDQLRGRSSSEDTKSVDWDE